MGRLAGSSGINLNVFDTIGKESQSGKKVKKGKMGRRKKRRFSPEDEDVEKKIMARDYPRGKSCILYLREGKWVTARIKHRVYKSKQKCWYNVEHLNESIPDVCVNF